MQNIEIDISDLYLALRQRHLAMNAVVIGCGIWLLTLTCILPLPLASSLGLLPLVGVAYFLVDRASYEYILWSLVFCLAVLLLLPLSGLFVQNISQFVQIEETPLYIFLKSNIYIFLDFYMLAAVFLVAWLIFSLRCYRIIFQTDAPETIKEALLLLRKSDRLIADVKRHSRYYSHSNLLYHARLYLALISYVFVGLLATGMPAHVIWRIIQQQGFTFVQLYSVNTILLLFFCLLTARIAQEALMTLTKYSVPKNPWAALLQFFLAATAPALAINFSLAWYAFGELPEPWPLQFLLLLGVCALGSVLVGAFTYRMIEYGLRNMISDADGVIDTVGTAPVVLLRSFDADSLLFAPKAGVSSLDTSTKKIRFEEVFSRELERVGPLIAIAKPGEWRTPLGAMRSRFPDHTWQSKVIEWLEVASLVVVILGQTEGLRWEIEAIQRFGHMNKLLVIIPPMPSDRQTTAWRLFSSLDWGNQPDSIVNLSYSVSDTLVVFWDQEKRINSVVSSSGRQFEYELAVRMAIASLLSRKSSNLSEKGVRHDAGEALSTPLMLLFNQQLNPSLVGLIAGFWTLICLWIWQKSLSDQTMSMLFG